MNNRRFWFWGDIVKTPIVKIAKNGSPVAISAMVCADCWFDKKTGRYNRKNYYYPIISFEENVIKKLEKLQCGDTLLVEGVVDQGQFIKSGGPKLLTWSFRVTGLAVPRSRTARQGYGYRDDTDYHLVNPINKLEQPKTRTTSDDIENIFNQLDV
jgi:hypothetical protein